MIRMRVSIAAAAGVSLAALAWFLPDVQFYTAAGSSDAVGRAIGVALLGSAMIAVGLVFRWAMAEPEALSTPTHRRGSEFRRGFAERSEPRLKRPVARPNVPRGVIALRQAILTEASKRRAPLGEAMPTGDIKRLQELLQSRVAQLGTRDVASIQPRILRNNVDGRDRPRH